MKVRNTGFILWKLIILPKSDNKDLARQEFILNILLLGTIVLSFIAFLMNIVSPMFHPSTYTGEQPVFTLSVLIFMIFLLVLSRKGHSIVSASILMFLLFALGVYANYKWGADVPITLVLYALIIVMTGILISTKFAFLFTILSGVSILLFAYLESHQLHRPDYRWKHEIVHIEDTVIYIVMLAIVAVSSWLSNREIEKLLHRAWKSESALRKQKNQLELTVEKRTRELRLAQAEKMTQLYRFAEFGRLASGLFHDLVNPLNLVSLNLNKLHTTIIQQETPSDVKVLVERSMIGILRLENFISAARKQILKQEVTQKFSLRDGISQAVQVLRHKAMDSKVNIKIYVHTDIIYFGNPIKFNQLVSNLLSNAIESYDNTKKIDKRVEITLTKSKNTAIVSVTDWGSGINKKIIPKIFDPLFTTKSIEKGTGIGLSICKDIIKKDFKGKCTVQTKEGIGTTFIIEFPIRKSPRSLI